MRFAADRTVGRLAKWLRMAGFDTLFQGSEPDGRFIEATMEVGRIFLTRRRRLPEALQNCMPSVLLSSDHLEDQIDEVLRVCRVERSDLRPFSRCIRCNTEIRPLERQAAWGRVPEFTWNSHEVFQSCPVCGRIYWPGSHAVHMLRRIERSFEPHSG